MLGPKLEGLDAKAKKWLMDDFQNTEEMQNAPIGPKINLFLAKYLGDRFQSEERRQVTLK